MLISQRLKMLRKEKKLSQEDIAPNFFVSRQVYANWESDRSEPAINELILIANFHSVSIDYLCGVTDIRDRIYEDPQLCKYLNKCIAIYDEFFEDKNQEK